MSATQRLKQGFLRLPSPKKIILLSSGLLMLSPIMPWYDNRNTFGVGDLFLGFQGPLFLVGILVSALGALCFFNLFLPLFGKNFFKLKRKSGFVALIAGTQALLLMLVANSVFYHPLFSTNVSHKSSSIGLIIAFVSVTFLMASGWMAHRKEKTGDYPDLVLAEKIEENEEDMDESNDWGGHQAARDYQGQQENAFEARPLERVQRPVQGFQQAPVSNMNRAGTRQVSAYQGDHFRLNESHSGVRTQAQTAQPAQNQMQSQNTEGVDPLTLDPKTRYKMMKQRMRQEQSPQANSNLWGRTGNGQAYGGTRLP
jgi:hypothetical protein